MLKNPLGELLYGLYAGLTSVLYALAWPVLAALGLRSGAAGREWRERLGWVPAGLPRGAVWIHAASVGEVVALGPLLREIARHRPRLKVALAVMTLAGKHRAQALYRCPVVQAPLDAPLPARRWLRRAAPKVLIVMETELWPVWLATAAARIPVAWVNGRVSDRSFPRYRLVRPLMEKVLTGLSLLCVISRNDASRATRLGARPLSIQVTGNLKVDLLQANARPLGVLRGLWFVAGSTRPGEEAVLLEAFLKVKRRHPRARLCLAPRHLNRVEEVASLAIASGFLVAHRSRGDRPDADVLVLDTHGELAAFYRLGIAAFVGGTLVPVGGHNVLEPALAGVPVLFGPHTANFRQHAAGLERCGGGLKVASAGALAKRWARLLSSPRAARRAGAHARDYVRSQQGVARRVVRILAAEGFL